MTTLGYRLTTDADDCADLLGVFHGATFANETRALTAATELRACLAEAGREEVEVEVVRPTTAGQAINAALRAAGMTKLVDQAELLGENPSHWSSRYSSGKRSAQGSKIQEWIAMAAADGWRIIASPKPDGWDAVVHMPWLVPNPAVRLRTEAEAIELAQARADALRMPWRIIDLDGDHEVAVHVVQPKVAE